MHRARRAAAAARAARGQRDGRRASGRLTDEAAPIHPLQLVGLGSERRGAARGGRIRRAWSGRARRSLNTGEHARGLDAALHRRPRKSSRGPSRPAGSGSGATTRARLPPSHGDTRLKPEPGTRVLGPAEREQQRRTGVSPGRTPALLEQRPDLEQPPGTRRMGPGPETALSKETDEISGPHGPPRGVTAT